MKKIFNIAIMMILASLATVSCKKDSLLYDGPMLAHFQSKEGTLFLQPGGENTIIIPIGLTKAVDHDVVVTVELDSSSTAEAGKQFNFVSQQVTIPAGQVIGNLVIKGDYDSASVASLAVFRITSDALQTGDTYTLELQQFCPFNQADFVGFYQFSAVDPADAMLGSEANGYQVEAIADPNDSTSIIFQNLYNDPDDSQVIGGYDVKISFDDSDVNNIKVTIADGQTMWFYTDGTFDGTVVSKGGTGTFNGCAKTITFSVQHILTSIGFNFGTDVATLKKIN